MGVTLLRFCLLVLLALLVGTMFGIWIGYNPATLSAQAYVEQQQNAIDSLNVLLPAMGGVCIFLGIMLALSVRKTRPALLLLIISIVLLIASGLITRFGNQPLNAIVMTWSPQTPPSSWMQVRSEWWYWHTLRTVAGMIALALVVLETLWHNRAVDRPM